MLAGLRSPTSWEPPAWPNGTFTLNPDGKPYSLHTNGSDYQGWATASPPSADGVQWGFSPEGEAGGVRWPVGLLLVTLTVLIAFGNTLVVLAVLVERQLRTVENVFFASLAVADLSIALFVLPLTLSVELSGGRWRFGRTACVFFIFVDVSCCTASILHLCAIGLSRYRAVASPLRHGEATGRRGSPRRALLAVAAVWLLSFAIASPPLFGWPRRSAHVPGQCTYDEDRLYVVCSAAGSFYLPLVVMLTVYYRIYRLSQAGAKFRRSCMTAGGKPRGPRSPGSSGELVVVGQARGTGNSPRDRSKPGSPLRALGGPGLGRLWSLVRRTMVSSKRRGKSGMRLAEVKTAKTLGLIVTVFVVCWLPFFVLYVLRPFCPHCRIPVLLDRCALWLGYANSLLNPVIYICCKPLFRRTFKKILLLDYCRILSQYSLEVTCCPARQQPWRRASRCHRRRHVVSSDDSYSYRAEYGHLNANVPPEILQEDDRPYRDSPTTSQGASCPRRPSASSERDGALPSYCSTSARHPSSGGLGSSLSSGSGGSSGSGVIQRVPNACVTDIPLEPCQGTGIVTQAAAIHPHYHHQSRRERETGREAREQLPPRRSGEEAHRCHHRRSSSVPSLVVAADPPPLEPDSNPTGAEDRPVASGFGTTRTSGGPPSAARSTSTRCPTDSRTPGRAPSELPTGPGGAATSPGPVRGRRSSIGNGGVRAQPSPGESVAETTAVIKAIVHVGSFNGVNETTL